MKKKKKKKGRKPLIDGERTEYIGVFVPRSMRTRLSEVAHDNQLNMSRIMRLIINDFLESAHENVERIDELARTSR